MIRLTRLLLVSALMISIGAQWVVLQSAAWIGMAVSYSIETRSVSEGLSKTFDGEHPCKLCCMVEKGTDAEKKETKKEESKQKVELFASSDVLLQLPLPECSDLLPAENQWATARANEPIDQPPRRV